MSQNHLIPFQDDHYTQKITVTASVTIEDLHYFTISWRIHDPSRTILWGVDFQDHQLLKNRTENLWKKTCMEAFWQQPNSSKYFELNVDSMGQWNIFEFDSYRQRAPVHLSSVTSIQSKDRPTELKDVKIESFKALQLDSGIHEITVRVFSTSTLSKDSLWGLTCVIEQAPHSLSYWALKHTQAEADFHHSSSWLLYVDLIDPIR